MILNQEYFEDAGFLLGRERGEHDEYIEFRVARSSLAGSSAEAISTQLSAYILDEISSPSSLLSAAIYALGQSHDARFASLYVRVMKKTQVTNISACLQAALAYEKLGFNVFLDRELVVDEDAIIREINMYLRNTGG